MLVNGVVLRARYARDHIRGDLPLRYIYEKLDVEGRYRQGRSLPR